MKIKNFQAQENLTKFPGARNSKEFLGAVKSRGILTP